MRAISRRFPRVAAQVIAVVLVLAGVQIPTAAFAAPVTAGSPTISGSTAVGSTLTVSEGTWDPVGTAFVYEWRRDGVAIVGATSTNSVLPTITGTATVGSVLTASAGTWSPTADSTTYQWLRGSTPIAGATSTTYTLVSVDRGKNIRVRVTVVTTNYTTTSKTSAIVRIS